ncbi:MAG: TonB-dependent receptor plug domain-containing protein [Pseudomonadales bacterium]|nr:TonB-dependent receptor plug domain-containing protein [Pseudomonadales bacterium]
MTKIPLLRKSCCARLYLLGLWICGCFIISTSHADELMFGISEDISDVAETTSSKRLSDLFSSPVSISTVDAEAIKNAGITSVAEALKLVPGAIVVEQLNGHFEVYLRGFQNVPSNGTLTELSGRLNLVMVDNRTVYNYFHGGTFWETLPIHVDDIERIEVIRGASSALYGSNAVTGVIHFITKRAKEPSKYRANLTAGSYNTKVGHFSIEKYWQDHAIRLSGYKDQRDRSQSTYYNPGTESYIDIMDIPLGDVVDGYEDPNKSRDVQSFLIAINNDSTKLLHYDFTLSHENSTVQKSYIGLTTPISVSHSQSSAANLKVNYLDFDFRTSIKQGEHAIGGFPDFNQDFKIYQTNLEYTFKFPKWIIRPGLNYDSATYAASFVDKEEKLTTESYLVRTEYTPTNDIKIVAALRYDDYSVADDNYLSYQLLGTYLLNENTLLRAGVSTANQSAFMFNSLFSLEIEPEFLDNIRILYEGMEDAKLAKMTTYELGVRHNFSFNNWLDIEIFHSKFEDPATYAVSSLTSDPPFTVVSNNLVELPTTATQNGITANWQYEHVNWDLNLFATYQETELDNQFRVLIQPLEYYDTDAESVPNWTAGFVTNWKPDANWNLNFHGYYLGDYDIELEPSKGGAHSPSNFLLNMTARRHFNRWVEGSLSFKNLFGNTRSQHFNTDFIKPTILFSIRVNFDHEH